MRQHGRYEFAMPPRAWYGLAMLTLTPAAPRIFWQALVLTLVMPGLGHVYCGRVRQGLLLWIGVLVALLLAGAAWAYWLFLPTGPIALAVCAWLTLQAVLIADLRRWIGRHGAVYRLRPVNHPLTYISVGLGLGALPILAGVVLLAYGYVGSAAVRGYEMFPGLLPGDSILFDRTAYVDQPPNSGELVVVEHGQTLAIGRVIAVGGQTVRLYDGRPTVVGRPIRRQPLNNLHVKRFETADATRLAGLSGFQEYNQQRRYIVTYSRDLRIRTTTSARLAADEIYVLGDNRDIGDKHLINGRIHLSAVRGRPQCIWGSTDARGDARVGRAGLEVR